MINANPSNYQAMLSQLHPGDTLAYVYNNTIYTSQQGIFLGSPAQTTDAVTGNLVFAGTPISGSIKHESDNMTDTVQNASTYVNAPSFELGVMNLYPLPGKVEGSPLNLAPFSQNVDYTLDFNGVPKDQSSGQRVFRGAYAGDGTNPGWKLQAGIKP